MNNSMNRRDLLKLTGMGVAVFVSGTTLFCRRLAPQRGGVLLFCPAFRYPLGLQRTQHQSGSPRLAEKGGGCCERTR